MEDHWQPSFDWTVPNPQVYPWMWSWDSCFHAMIWDALDDERALSELKAVFGAQTWSGFVPHMNYAPDPDSFFWFWGAKGASTLTQPPMYGHAIAVLAEHGRPVEPLVEPALRAMRHLFEARRAPCGLLRIFHPWESGIDDHPRWQAWQPVRWDRREWHETKGRLVQALTVDDGEAVSSTAFDVCSAGFNSLAAWNARRLATVASDPGLARLANDLAACLDEQWDDKLATWRDVTPQGAPLSSIRSLDAVLAALVTSHPDRAARTLRLAVDPAAFGSAYGPSGVHVDEPSFDPAGYGRGATWPHLAYLLWVAARQRNLAEVQSELARALAAGADRSGLAEYWNPFSGRGLGARPQAWAGVCILATETVSRKLIEDPPRSFGEATPPTQSPQQPSRTTRN
jgi:hypothetical protein